MEENERVLKCDYNFNGSSWDNISSNGKIPLTMQQKALYLPY
jgi:hypothetical protein